MYIYIWSSHRIQGSPQEAEAADGCGSWTNSGGISNGFWIRWFFFEFVERSQNSWVYYSNFRQHFRKSTEIADKAGLEISASFQAVEEREGGQ